MFQPTLNALLVLRDLSATEPVGSLVRSAGFQPCCVSTLEKARRELEARPFQLVLSDMRLADGSGLELLSEIAKGDAPVDAVFFSDSDREVPPSEAGREGTIEILTKPLDLDRLKQILDAARRAAILIQRVAELHGRLAQAPEDLKIRVGMSISAAERILLLATLEALNGDKRRAAKMLGVSLKTLYNRLNSYGAPAPRPPVNPSD